MGQPTITAGSPALLRSLNARAVLDTLDKSGPLGRPELCTSTGLSKTAIAQTLNELERRGAVERAGLDVNRRGPAATLYRIVVRAALGAAVDIGHRGIRVAIFGLDREPLAQAAAIADHSNAHATAATVRVLLERACEQADAHTDELQVAVVGVPAVVTAEGRLRLASGLAAGGRDLPSALAASLPCPIVLENDTNLAAIAEHANGSAVGEADFVLLSIGASTGAAIVMNGELQRGRSGGAGEVLYLPGPNDRVDDSLGSVSIETDAALEGIPDRSVRQIFEDARSGDPAALAVIERTAHRIARPILALILVLDPGLIVLGGSIGSNADVLAAPVVRHLRGLFPHAMPRIVGASAGPHPVLLGAAHLCGLRLRDESFSRATRGSAWTIGAG